MGKRSLWVSILTLGCGRSVTSEVVLEARDVHGRPVAVRAVGSDGWEMTSGRDGILSWNPNGKPLVEFWVVPASPHSALVPVHKRETLEASFFPKSVRMQVVLQEARVQADENTGEASSSGPSVAHAEENHPAHSFVESDIPPDIAPTPVLTLRPTALPPEPVVAAAQATAQPRATARPWATLPPMGSLPRPLPPEKTAGPAARGGNYGVTVRLSGAPRQGSQVYALSAGSRVPTLLGSTGADGRFTVSLPEFLHPDAFLIRDACCRSPIVPALSESEVGLENGPGVELALQTFAFGMARLLPGVEISGARGRAEVTGSSGLASLAMEALGGSRARLASRETLPTSVEQEVSPGGVHLRGVAMLKAPMAAVGLREDAPMGASPWRRFRREFFARFIQNAGFRPIVPQEVEKVAQGVALSPAEMERKGWEFTLAGPELDFMLALTYREAPTRVEALLVDRTGASRWQRSFPVAADAERSGGEAFEALVRAFPFEGALVRKSGDHLVSNLGNSRHGVSEGNRFELLRIPSGGGQPEHVGYARAVSVSDGETTLKPEGGAVAQVGDLVRRVMPISVAESGKNEGL